MVYYVKQFPPFTAKHVTSIHIQQRALLLIILTQDENIPKQTKVVFEAKQITNTTSPGNANLKITAINCWFWTEPIGYPFSLSLKLKYLNLVVPLFPRNPYFDGDGSTALQLEPVFFSEIVGLGAEMDPTRLSMTGHSGGHIYSVPKSAGKACIGPVATLNSGKPTPSSCGRTA